MIFNYLLYVLKILLAPFYFHFGHYALFIEIISYCQELVETIGIYLLVFIFILNLIFYRNYLFLIFNKNIFKNTNINFIKQINYNNSFFNNIKNFNFFFKKK